LSKKFIPEAESLISLLRNEYKKKGRKLYVVADWDDCLQPVKPMVIARMNPHLIKDLDQFLKNYWDASVGTPSVSGSQILVSVQNFKGSPEQAEAVNKFEEFRKESRRNPEKHNYLPSGGDLYAESPLLYSCDDLLQAIEEGLIEDLVIISSYRKGKHNGYANEGAETVVKQKTDKIKKTFGQFPFTKIDITGTDRSPVHNKHFIPYRWEILRDKYPNFDILIDDNPQILRECVRNLPRDKIYASEGWNATRVVMEDNIYFFPGKLSKLTNEDFEKRAKKFIESSKKSLNTNYDNKNFQAEKPKWYQWETSIGKALWIGIPLLILLGGGLTFWLLKRRKRISEETPGKNEQ
jgi:hypothetical protein